MTGMKVDRRTTIRLLAAAGAAVPFAPAQTPAPQPTPGSDLQSARQSLQDDAQRIATVKLPRATEPAFHFRA